MLHIIVYRHQIGGDMMTKINRRPFAVAFMLAALIAASGALAANAVDYARTSDGLVAAFTLETQPETTLYAISYADEPSIVDTSYVFERNGKMIAALTPGQVWLAGSDGAMNVYDTAALPVGLLPDRVQTNAMIGRMFTKDAMGMVSMPTSDGSEMTRSDNEPLYEWSTYTDDYKQENDYDDTTLKTQVEYYEPFDWKAYADAYGN